MARKKTNKKRKPKVNKRRTAAKPKRMLKDLDENNRKWKEQVDRGLDVPLTEEQIDDVDKKFWTVFKESESVHCPSGGGKNTEMTLTCRAILSGPDREKGCYACVVITERCASEVEVDNPERSGTRTDPVIVVSRVFGFRTTGRHSTRLLPPR